MSQLRALDLFCGAGGVSMGLHRAGFDVTGVDLSPQPHYPFRFRQHDALAFPLDGYDIICASPPCQRYSIANNIHARTDHPDLVDAIRERLIASGTPYIIENVVGAPLRSPILLCGLAFGLRVKRHRLFECSFHPGLAPPCPKGHPGDWVSVFGHTVLSRGHVIGKAKGGGNRIQRQHLGIDVGRAAMGIDWMNRDELSQAIPPAYSEWLARRFLEVRASEAA